jgi:hypothetical protein
MYEVSGCWFTDWSGSGLLIHTALRYLAFSVITRHCIVCWELADIVMRLVSMIANLVTLVNSYSYCVSGHYSSSWFSGIAQSCTHWLRVGRPRGRSSGPGKVQDYSLILSVHVATRAHRAANQVVSWCSFPRCKVTGAWSWPLIWNNAEVKKRRTCISRYVLMA